MKKEMFIFGIVFCLVLIASVSAEKVNSSANVTYDTDLLKAFENRIYASSLMNDKDFIGLKIIDDEVWARVMIILKDNSNIEIVGDKSEKRELVNQRVEWFESETEKLISTLSNEHIKEINRNSGGFSALVSKEGLDELKDEGIIDEISWSQYKPKLILEESATLINADDAWSSGYTGDGIKVCIIDSGIDTDHSSLSSQIVDEKCYNSDNDCPDNTAEDDSAEDSGGHGTRVAGVIASQDFWDRGIAYDVDVCE